MNEIYHANSDSKVKDREGHLYFLDNLKFENHFSNNPSKCYRENILSVEDWMSSNNESFVLPDSSQISSKSPIGFRIERYIKDNVNTKDFPPSNQYHHIESFSRMKINIGGICNIEFARIKDITDNITTFNIILHIKNKENDNIIRSLSVIDKIINLINSNQNYDPKKIREINIHDLR